MTENENNNQINNAELNQTAVNTKEEEVVNVTSPNKSNNNKKKIIIIAIAAIIIVILIIMIIVFGSKHGQNPGGGKGTKEPTIEDKKEAEDIFSSNDVQNISGNLYTYAIELYNNKKYLDFQKDQRGVYYASKYDLELEGYDVSIIDESCNDEDAIIYFDIDHIMNETYETEPIVYMAFCPKK